MIPYINVFSGYISTFGLCITIGILTMLIVIHLFLSKSANREKEESFIFPKIVISGTVGFFCAGFSDSLFKIKISGEFRIAGINFYGGLIGSIICLFVLLKCTKQNTQYAINEWYNLMTIPLVSFHFFGRIGCFLGGCCYGKNTNSVIGILFPDIPEHDIFHYGIKCYPTQLFEAAVLIIIFFVILFVNKKFEIYLLMYSVSRFLIEFFRGDNRGYIIEILSPAQLISVIIFFIVIFHMLYKRKNLYAIV